MHNFGIQVDSLQRDEEIEGRVFELYEKTPNREFKSHVQFIKAENLCEAEDKISEADPAYWRTRSVRPVNVEYVWDTFTQLYYSYSMAKSVLGLSDLDE
jgi:hypothetical protein|tara:strand:+ start:323 stop:619 length:297 start_codon:yes stop_codon:yes gene_type:complete